MNTVTNTLTEKLSKMDKKALADMALTEYGLNISENVPVEKIREEILRQHEARIGKAKTMNEKSAMMVANSQDPLLEVVFRPVDFPNADLGPFVYDSGRGLVNKKLSKADQQKQRERGYLDKLPKYHLFPGQRYKLPASVVKHLQGLTYLDSEPVYDPATGMISGNRPIKRPRFSLDIQLSDEQVKKIGTTSL